MSAPRNSICLCGSGLKHKRCCGNEAKKSADRQFENQEMIRRIEQRRMDIRENPRHRKMSSFASLAVVAALLGSGRR